MCPRVPRGPQVLAVLRRKVFRDPPTESNQAWQSDFSEFETSQGGTWRICAAIDYATKYWWRR